MLSTLRLILSALAISGASSAQAATPGSCLPPECTAFPTGSGFLNVRDYGVKGDGVTDDTAAINAVLRDSGNDTGPTFWHDQIVYFPAGQYLVSGTIEKRYPEGRYGSGAILIGESRKTTIIRLKEAAPGYGDPANPKAVIFTSAKLLDGNATSGGKDYTNKGEGNDAFMNFVENMTIDVGGNNPGAIGIDYLANNVGAIRNVLVHAEEGSGATGIALTRKWPGPALLQNVIVQGFTTGIDVGNTEYGITMEHIRLEKQKETGLRNDHNVLSVHDLTITGAKLPIDNRSPDGLIVITGATLEQTAAEAQVMKNAGSLNLRNVKVKGFKAAKDAKPTSLDGIYKDTTRLGDAAPDWALAAKEPPAPPADDPLSKWVASPMPVDPKADATDSIRRAFASGASTIYFPHGTYLIGENITVPPSVQRIVGMTSTIHVHPKHNLVRSQGMFRANNTQPLIIEKIAFDNSYLGDDQVGVEAMGTGPLVLRDVIGAGVVTVRRPETGGEVFLENTCCGTLSFEGSNGVWARQLNTEGMNTRITNKGAPMWILGIKTEKNCTILDNTSGARTEILGGLIYITGTSADPAIPAFRNTDAKLSLSYVEESFHPDSTYAVHVVNTQQGKTKNLTAQSLPQRTIGRMVPGLIAQ